MSRTTGIYVLLGLLILVGAFVRLDIEHANVANFVTFISGAIVPMIAAIASIKAHGKASEAKDTAQTAADSAAAAENNTNGKMAAQFAQVRGLIQNVDHKLDEHLLEHIGGGQ